MALREEYAGVGKRAAPLSPIVGKDYTILGYGNDGQPIVFAPTVSPGKPIPLAEYEAIRQQQAAQSGPQRFMGQAAKAAEMFAGAGGMGAVQGAMLPPPGGPLAGRASASMSQTQQAAVGPARIPPAQAQLPGPTPQPARVIPPAQMSGPPSIPTYTPEVVPGPTNLRAFSGKVTQSTPIPPSGAPQMPPAMGGQSPLRLPSANAAPTSRSYQGPGGLDPVQMSQMDTAAANIAGGFTKAPIVPTWAKAAGGAAVGLGAAALAGRNAGKESQTGAMPWNPSDLGAPIADAFAKLRGYAQPGAEQGPAAEPAATPSPTTPQRGPTRPLGGYKVAGGAGAGVGGDAQQVGYGAPGSPRSPAANYYSDMLGAADSGDAYARDLVNLTSQAREVAFKAQQEGKHLQFVPLHDMRNNRLFLVNANGQDVVLDLNDEGDKAAFGRMTAKIGVDPASIMAWAQGSSRPLHRYMVPPGSQGDWAPKFNEPGQQQPQVGAQSAPPAEPTASAPPFELPQVPKFSPGAPLPTMRGLNVTADRPVDERFAEINALREQGLGGPQLDERERKLREARANNPAAYARGLGG